MSTNNAFALVSTPTFHFTHLILIFIFIFFLLLFRSFSITGSRCFLYPFAVAESVEHETRVLHYNYPPLPAKSSITSPYKLAINVNACFIDPVNYFAELE